MDKRTLEREIQQANSSLNFYDMKAARIEDQVSLWFITKNWNQLDSYLKPLKFALQLKICSDQIQKLVEDKFQSSVMMDSTQKKLLEVKRSSEQSWGSLEKSQSKVDQSRGALLELQIELEKERYRCT